MRLFQHSLLELLEVYKNNQDAIKAYVKGEPVEGFSDLAFSGMTGTAFLVVLAITIGIFIWALILTMHHWHDIPTWAKVVSMLGLIGAVTTLPIGPIITIIVVLVSKNKYTSNK